MLSLQLYELKHYQRFFVSGSTVSFHKRRWGGGVMGDVSILVFAFISSVNTFLPVDFYLLSTSTYVPIYLTYIPTNFLSKQK